MEDGSLISTMNGYLKPHHRVLKPPGGESHDIFGTRGYSNGAANGLDTPQRRIKNHMQSTVFGDSPDAVTPKQQNGNGSIGSVVAVNGKKAEGAMEEEEDEEKEEEVQPVPSSAKKVKDHMRSSVFADLDPVPQVQRRKNLGGGGGNPITGEGYKTSAATNGEPKENGHSGVRVRNPPGGHCNKLW